MEISAPYDNPIAGFARSASKSPLDGQLSIFDLRARKRLADFPVVYRSSLGRFSLSRDSGLCFLGCFEEHGLAAYSTQDGSELWRRNDLQALNAVVCFNHEDVVSCCCGSTELFLLCAQTGRTLDIQHGIHRVHSSPFSKAVLLSARDLELHLPFGKRIGTIPRETFIELGCAFSNAELVITDAQGSVRCFDLQSLEPLWTHKPLAESRFVQLCYSQPLDCFVGVWWDYKDEKHPVDRLLHFARRTGNVTKEVRLDTDTRCDARYAFCLAGSVLLGANMRVVSAETGGLLYEFEQSKNSCG